MSVFAGPNIASNSNLVFAYDMNNTQKSWIGPPITNLVANKTLTAHGGNTPTINNSYSLVAPDNSTGWGSILSSGPTGNYRLAQFPYITLTSGTTYTASMEFFTTETQTLSVFMDGNAGLTPTNIPNGYSKWTFTFTATNNWVENIFIGSFNTISSTTYSPPKLVYFKNPQLEVGSFATPYAENTRTNTQSIIDLTRNNIITATSLTYLSSGTFSFNGTSNQLNTGILPYQFLTTGVTISLAFRYTQTTTNDNVISWGNSAFNAGLSYSWELRIRGGGAVEFSPGVYTIGTAPARLNYNQTTLLNGRDVLFDVVYNANGMAYMYENGVQVASYDYTGVGTYTNTQALRIGRGSDSNFPGNIYFVKIYNRPLSAAEIAQNFNATRSRFGL